MTQHWICWSEFLQPWEAVPLCEGLVISRQDLDLVAWVQEEQRGRPLYRGDVDQQEVTVWRDEDGRLLWDAIHYTWLVESQIEQLAALLKARGFPGTRTDECTLTKHVVIFQYGTARLALRASQREVLSHRTLMSREHPLLPTCSNRPSTRMNQIKNGPAIRPTSGPGEGGCFLRWCLTCFHAW